MVFLIRLIAVLLFGVFICLTGSIFCLFNPRNPKNVARFSHLFGIFLTPLFGVKVITREYPNIRELGSCVFIANHQNNYDVLVASNIVQPNTVTIGKKSLVWVPFFGTIYWLTGNILLDRNNKSKARETLTQVVDIMHQKGISVWMFPEGTRSKGRGLLPFKTGAFRTAIAAQVPIVPICVSDTNDIRLNRWNNGHMIVEMLAPIETKGMSKEDAKGLMDQCYQLMSNKIAELNEEAKQQNEQS